MMTGILWYLLRIPDDKPLLEIVKAGARAAFNFNGGITPAAFIYAWRDPRDKNVFESPVVLFLNATPECLEDFPKFVRDMAVEADAFEIVLVAEGFAVEQQHGGKVVQIYHETPSAAGTQCAGISSDGVRRVLGKFERLDIEMPNKFIAFKTAMA